MRKIVLGIVAALSLILASASDANAQPLRARLGARAALNNWGYSGYSYPSYSSGYYYPSYYSSGYYYPSYSSSGYYYPSNYYDSSYYNSGYYNGWYPGSTIVDTVTPRVGNFLRGGRWWGY